MGPLRVAGIARIVKDAAGQQVAVKVRYQRADVAQRQVLCLQIVGELLYLPRPVPLVALVDAVESGLLGDPDVRVGEQKLAYGLVQRKALHPVARTIDQHRAGAVEDVSRRDNAPPRLQAILYRARRPFGRFSAHNVKDRADAHRIVDVGRSVQRVKEHHVPAAGVLLWDGDDVGDLLRAHDGQAPGELVEAHDGRIGVLVELGYLLSLHVESPGQPQDIGQSGPRRLAGDQFAGQGQVV